MNEMRRNGEDLEQNNTQRRNLKKQQQMEGISKRPINEEFYVSPFNQKYQKSKREGRGGVSSSKMNRRGKNNKKPQKPQKKRYHRKRDVEGRLRIKNKKNMKKRA